MSPSRRQRLILLYRFIRFPALAFTLPLTPLGALSASHNLSVVQWCALLSIGLAFHIFAYVSNDLIDLPLDRSEPLRRHYPLVTGAISVRTALLVALAQIPLALLLMALIVESSAGYLWLAAAFIGMSIYNLWGKRLAWPILADGVQALAWSALILTGRAVDSTPLGPIGVGLLLYYTLAVLLINGIHGGLRDLENDRRCGAQTTAIWLGATIDERGRLTLPFTLSLYALALQIALTLASLYPLLVDSVSGGIALLPMLLTVSLLAMGLLLATLSVRNRRSQFLLAGALHLVITLLPPLVLASTFATPRDLTILWSLLLIPLIPMWLQSQYSGRRSR